MSSPSWEFLQHILLLLRNDTVIAQYAATIVTHMPKQPQFPLIYIGKVDTHDASSKTHVAQKMRVAVHVMCRGQLREVAEELLAASQRTLTTHNMHITTTTMQQKDDGVTYHGTLDITILRRA
jgi:hypothetical protein